MLGHPGGAGRSALEVARRILGIEIAPALEGAERPRLHQHQLAVEDEAASSDAVLVDEGTDVEHAFAAHDRAADDPEQRPAVDQLIHPLRHHAGGVDVLALLLAMQLLGDPVLQFLDRVAADAKLDEMQGHYCPCSGVITMTVARSAIWLPAAARTSLTRPLTGASSVCSIFIASMTARRCPLVTVAPGSTSTARSFPCIGARRTPLPSR